MAREDLKVGQTVRYSRMSNKAISLTGTIKQLNDDGKTVLIESEDFAEDAHINDVTILDGSETKPEKSLTTVNGKPV